MFLLCKTKKKIIKTPTFKIRISLPYTHKRISNFLEIFTNNLNYYRFHTVTLKKSDFYNNKNDFF